MDTTRRTAIVQIRATAQEQSAWRRAAAASGVTLSAYIRVAVAAAIDAQVERAANAAAAAERARLTG